jgi:preprotein translocase subunit SecD
VKVTVDMVARVEETLKAAQVTPDYVRYDNGSVRARFRDIDNQIKARDALLKALNTDPADPRYIVALNLVSRTPEWMASVRAMPMYLGLDLRGGVHFLMQVDMRGALKQAVETYASDARTALREKRIRFTGIARETNGLTVTLPDAAEAAKARDLLFERLPSMTWTREDQGDTVRILGRLSPQAIIDIQNQAVAQNVETLHKRVNELGVAEPVIQRQGADRVVVQLPGTRERHPWPHGHLAVPSGRQRHRDGGGGGAHAWRRHRRPEARRHRHRRAAQAGLGHARPGPAPRGEREARRRGRPQHAQRHA